MTEQTIDPLLYETDKFKIWQEEKGIKVFYKPENHTNHFTHDLMERVWEFVDEGKQPVRYDGTWNVEADEYWGGLNIYTKVGSGGTSWGMTTKVYEALCQWRKQHRPKTVKEQTVIELKDLQELASNGTSEDLKQYEETIKTAIRLLEEKIIKEELEK